MAHKTTELLSDDLLAFCKQNLEKWLSYPDPLTGYTIKISCSLLLTRDIQVNGVPRHLRGPIEEIQKLYKLSGRWDLELEEAIPYMTHKKKDDAKEVVI